ncbi:MAG: YdcF family protein [Planctomycetaceae bacterium]
MDSTNHAHSWKSFFGTTLLMIGCGGVYLGAIYAVSGRVVVEKALLQLAMPCGIVWVLLTLLCLQLRKSKGSPLFFLAAIAWVAFSVLGNGQTHRFLIRHLEGEYLSLRPLEEDEPFEAIVVLGGGAGLGANGESQVNLFGSRIVLAARMYHSGLTKKIICTGQAIKELAPDDPDPADHGERILTQLDVPKSAIEKSGGINTSKEMENLSKRFNKTQRIGLITSALHMNRAMRLARKNGLDFTPLPAGFRSPPKRDWTFGRAMMSVLPHAEALSGNKWAMRELLARLVGR